MKGDDEYKASMPRAKLWLTSADTMAWLVPMAMTSVCVLTESPVVFLSSLLTIFVAISAPTLFLCWLLQLVSDSWGERIQGERKRAPPIQREVWETTRCLYTVACIAAWPVSRYRLGHETGITWRMEDVTDSWFGAGGLLLVGVVFADFWSYWKHRLLHWRPLFAFHKNHHQFRDPTAFAGFALHPVDALLTFAPIWAMCFPSAKQWMPLYLFQITVLSVLNLYLHCGVTFPWMEWLIPKMLLNTSGYHNVHHSKVSANYGEVSFVWDYICGTTEQALLKRRARRSTTQN